MSVTPDTSNLFLNGPWLSAFAVTVPLPLQSKSNFRRFKSGASTSLTSSFENSVGLLVKAARPDGWLVGDRDMPVADRPLVVSYIRGKSNIDVANYSKSVLDACQGVLYVSDASVQSCMATGIRGGSSSFMLSFAQVSPGSTPDALEEALHAMVRISRSLYALS